MTKTVGIAMCGFFVLSVGLFITTISPQLDSSHPVFSGADWFKTLAMAISLMLGGWCTELYINLRRWDDIDRSTVQRIAREAIELRKHRRFWQLVAGEIVPDGSIESVFASALAALLQSLRPENHQDPPEKTLADDELLALGAAKMYVAMHTNRLSYGKRASLNEACGFQIYTDQGFSIEFFQACYRFCAGGLAAVLPDDEEAHILGRPSSLPDLDNSLLRAVTSTTDPDTTALLKSVQV